MRFFFNATSTTAIYTLSLHDALPIYVRMRGGRGEGLLLPDFLQAARRPHRDPALRHEGRCPRHHHHAGGQDQDRKSTRLNSSHANISYAVFCLKKKKKHRKYIRYTTQ